MYGKGVPSSAKYGVPVALRVPCTHSLSNPADTAEKKGIKNMIFGRKDIFVVQILSDAKRD